MPRIWITRTQPFADESAARLRALGHDVCAAPLLETRAAPLPTRLPSQDAQLIFTSRKAVLVFANALKSRHWPCICVGDATADMAREAGFETVHSSNGNADDLILWIQKNISRDLPLYHASGAHPRGDIIKTLKQAGFSDARREIFYNTQSAQKDPRDDPRGDDIVLLYSPMAAASLMALGLDMQNMQLISLSRAVDEALGGAVCQGRHVAAHPSESSLFAHLPSVIM